MSTVKANNHQIGQSGTATNNFTLYQPSTPDGTVRLAVGNSGATTGDVLSVSNTGLSVTGTLSATGNVSFDGGTFVFNESGADKDFRIEGDTEPNLFFTDASTDRVGIGTSSPQSLLNTASTGQVQIGTSSWPTSFIGKSNARTIIGNEGVLILWNEAAATAGNEAALYIGPKGSGTNGSTIIAGGYVKGISESSSTNNGALTFGTNSGGGNSEKMRLDSSGNLGLGVTPSAWMLPTIETQSQMSFGTFGVGRNVYYATGYAAKYITSGYASRYSQSSGIHIWETAPSGFGYGTAATSLTSTQNGNSYTIVSAGTTDFTLIGAANNNVGTTFTKSGGTGTGTGTVSQNISFTQAMTLDASGNLVVGNTSANGRIEGVSTSSTYSLVANNSASSADQNFLQFRASSTIVGDINRPNATNDIEINAGYGALTFGTGTAGTATERARITSGGNLLVGTTVNTGATLAVCTSSGNFKLTKTFDQTFTTNPQTRNISLTINDGVALSVEITIMGNYSSYDYSGSMKQAYGLLTNAASTNLFGSANTSMYSLGNTSTVFAFGAATKPNNTTVNIPITYTGADTNTNLSVVVEIYGRAGGITAISFS